MYICIIKALTARKYQHLFIYPALFSQINSDPV